MRLSAPGQSQQLWPQKGFGNPTLHGKLISKSLGSVREKSSVDAKHRRSDGEAFSKLMHSNGKGLVRGLKGNPWELYLSESESSRLNLMARICL